MNTHLVEVFTERNCGSCEEVLGVLEGVLDQLGLSLKVYERQADQEIFLGRSVMVCPATFVDNRLAFYGSFSSEELSRYIKSQQSIIHNKE